MFCWGLVEREFPRPQMRDMKCRVTKKHTYANARQIQGIRLRMHSESIGLNEQLPASPFQRDTTQKSQCKRKYEVTVLANVIFHKVRYFIYTGREFQ